jgi:vitamin B12 transporter
LVCTGGGQQQRMTMKIRYSLSLAALIIANPVFAQEADAEEEINQDLIADCFTYCGPLVVDGQPARGLARSLGFSRGIEITDGSGAENALRNMPGLQQFRRSDSRSANPSGQGVTMRGLGGNATSRALVTLDGVPQMDPFGGWVSWTGIDTTAASSVVVSSGGGYVRTGPGAVAGLIEIASARADYGSYGNQMVFDVQGGSFGGASGHASGLVDIGGVIAQFSGSAERSDGFAPIIASQRGAVDGNAAYRNRGGALRLLKALSGDIELQANLRGWTDTRTRGTAFSNNSNGGTDASVRIVGEGSANWTLLGYFQDRDFSSQFASISADRNSFTSVLDQFAVPAKGWGTSGLIGFEAISNVQLNLGADWRHVEGETRENFFFTGAVPGRNRIAGGQSDTFGGFAEIDARPTDRLNLSLSGRLDRWRIADGFRREINIGGAVRSDDRFAKRQGTETTARAAFDWTILNDWTRTEAHLKGSLFTAWRLPTLNELYRPFRVGNDATAANEALAPERIKGAELGIEGKVEGVNLSFNAFANRLNRAIANVTVGQGPGVFPGVGFVATGGAYRQRRNLDAIVSKGVEIAASGWLTNNLRFDAGYSFVDAKVKASGAAVSLNGLRPAQVPKHGGRFSVLFDAVAGKASKASEAFIGSGVTIRYFGGQFEDDLNRLPMDDAITVDALLKYQLVDGVHLRLAAENLFNARVVAAVSNTGVIERTMPRSLMLGLRFDIR